MRNAFTSRFYNRDKWAVRIMTGHQHYPHGDSDSRFGDYPRLKQIKRRKFTRSERALMRSITAKANETIAILEQLEEVVRRAQTQTKVAQDSIRSPNNSPRT